MSDVLPPPGTPFAHLSRAERIARKDELRKQREELRNAMRFTLSKEGISLQELSKTAKDMAGQAVKEELAKHNLENMVYQAVNEAMTAAIAEVKSKLPGHAEIHSMIRKAIEEEAKRLAFEYVKNKIVVATKDEVELAKTAAYPGGGSF